MRYYQFLFSLVLFFSCSISGFAQNEEALKELLGELTLSDKEAILDFSKQQESDIDSEIIEVFQRLPEATQQAIIRYASALHRQHTSTSNNNVHKNHDHEEPTYQAEKTTNMTFDEPTYNFGNVKEGQKVRHTFMFTNTGSEPLIISNARGSCGCTVPKWPRKAVAPGASSEITVEFNTNGKGGKRNQKVTITANTTPSTTVINMVGLVTPKEKE